MVIQQGLFVMHSSSVFHRIAVFILLASTGLVAPPALAYNALEECLALSTEDDDVHACLDNYLDIMDDNIADITAYIERDLSGDALSGFKQSQEAFYAYRKENCLWYLTFSSPRKTAEQIAKNCLATMSQQRLSELQSLIATESRQDNTVRGFYVYGSNRNSFQPCDSNNRYWVEGDNALVGRLQQDYLNKTTAELQIIYVSLKGEIDEQLQAYQGHSGIFNLKDIAELRVPSESDCQLPTTSVPPPSTESTEPTTKISTPETQTGPEIQTPESDEPEQVLRAYFGDWFAECIQRRKKFVCDVSVEFEGSNVTDSNRPRLTLTRRTDERTVANMQFPDREVDSPAKIHWRVDGYKFGDIVGSEIRVDEVGTRQLISEKKFIRDDLMPLLLKGSKLQVEVLEDVDDNRGVPFNASLNGLTRALSFADDFVEGGDI